MSDILVLPADEWSCLERMRRCFDEAEFAKPHSEEVIDMLVRPDLLAGGQQHMIDMPIPVIKPFVASPVAGARTVAAVTDVAELRPLVSLDSYRVNFSIAAICAMASIAMLVDGSLLPVLATGTATICFACLGYAQRVIETKIAESLGEKKRPTSVKQ